MMWLLSMITCVNGKKVYESAIGSSIENCEWQEMVRKTFSSSESSCEMGKGQRGSWSACHALKKGTKRTVWKCLQCGAICWECQSDGFHEKDREMLRKGQLRPHHSYSKGKELSNLILCDERATQNLILWKFNLQMNEILCSLSLQSQKRDVYANLILWFIVKKEQKMSIQR